MKDRRIAGAQINCTVGDLEGNCMRILSAIEEAKAYGAHIVAFPELAVTGYPPEDLLLKPKFVEDNVSSLCRLARSVEGITAIVGFVDREDGILFNSAAVIDDREVKGVYHKMLLPNYGVFDEKRYFAPGREAKVFRLGDFTFGISICEDIWFKEGPTRAQAARGAKVIFNINASPYHAGKSLEREQIVRDRATKNRLFVAYTNLVGGQDELVFDGQGMVFDPSGHMVGRARAFAEDLLVVDLPGSALEGAGKRTRRRERGDVETVLTLPDKEEPREKNPVPQRIAPHLDLVPEVYEALLLGLRDYVKKNNFGKVTVGLSGGIDSALVAALAADALGRENVVAVFMPSRFTSRESQVDAEALARNLGIEFLTVPIDAMYTSYLTVLEPFFKGKGADITEENIQARIRGNILMALSNKFGWLVLTTGNKSEMSVGYATLYGDMAGGFAVIKDVPKVLVYDLCRYRNNVGRAIPENILVKAPTAELRPDQKDTDSLPPYDELDPILKAYIEEDRTAEEIISSSRDKEAVTRTLRMVDLSEYKRRQSPPGIKITPRAFGKDRRMPLTNRYRG